MGLIDTGAVKKALGDGVKTVQNAVGEGAKAASEAVNEGAKAVQEGVANIKVGEIAHNVVDAASDGAAVISNAIGNVMNRENDKAGEGEDSSAKEFIALLWCLAYADGIVAEEERAVLAEISASLDEGYESYAAEIEREFSGKLEDGIKEFGRQGAAKIEAQKIIESLELSAFEAKLLCWNLFALANADGLDEAEVDFIRFVSEKAGVDKSVVEELRNYSDAIVEVGKAREQLKQSSRSYAEIEPFISECDKRERDIVAAAQALISDR